MNKKGFTLVELIAVVVIIMILLGVLAGSGGEGIGVVVFIGICLFFSIFSKKKKITTSTINSTIKTSSTVSKVPNIELKCVKCGNKMEVTDKFCFKCGAAFEGNNVQVVQDTTPIVEMNQTYLQNEKIILKNLIIEEIKLQNENEKSFSIKSLNTKKNILLSVMGIITFISVLMFYFNYSLLLCGFIEVIGLLIYALISKRFNIINVIARKAISNPDTNISDIVKEYKLQKQECLLDNRLKLAIMIAIIILIPTLFCMTPKILYQRVGDGYYVLRYTRGIISESEVTIPSEYKGKPVIGIQENAFKNSKISKVNLPNKLERINTKAFYNCTNLLEITIPSTVDEIRASAFENNKSLVSVNLSEGLIEIRASAFKNCPNLVNIQLPNTLEYLGASAFSHCSSLTEITIPKNVIEINGQTFEYCTSLRTVNLHDDIISIHGEVFIGDSSLVNITLPPKITEVRGSTFEGCSSLTSIIIPEGVTRIGGHAFHGCTSLSNVSIPSSVREIGSSAFRQCYSLYNVSVPYSAIINERAFKESPTRVSRY